VREADLRREAAELVKKHWDEVSLLAKELTQWKRIEAIDAELILEVHRGKESVDALAPYRQRRLDEWKAAVLKRPETPLANTPEREEPREGTPKAESAEVETDALGLARRLVTWLEQQASLRSQGDVPVAGWWAWAWKRATESLAYAVSHNDKRVRLRIGAGAAVCFVALAHHVYQADDRFKRRADPARVSRALTAEIRLVVVGMTDLLSIAVARAKTREPWWVWTVWLRAAIAARLPALYMTPRLPLRSLRTEYDLVVDAIAGEQDFEYSPKRGGRADHLRREIDAILRGAGLSNDEIQEIVEDDVSTRASRLNSRRHRARERSNTRDARKSVRPAGK
jgi:hypothetical protein